MLEDELAMQVTLLILAERGGDLEHIRRCQQAVAEAALRVILAEETADLVSCG